MRRFIDSVCDHIPGWQRRRLRKAFDNFSRSAAEARNATERYGALYVLISRVLQFDRVAIRYIDHAHGTFSDVFVSGHSVNAWGLHSVRTLAGTLTEDVVNSGKSVVVEDCNAASFENRYKGFTLSAVLLPALLCVPIFSEGVVVGVVLLRSSKPGAYSDRELKLLELMTAHFTPVLVNSEGWATVKREAEERAVLEDIERLTNSVIDFSLVWEELVTLVKRLVPLDRMVLAIIQEDGETVANRFVYGVQVENWDDNPARKMITVPADGVIRTQRASIMTSADIDAVHFDLLGYKMSERNGLKSAMFAPLVASDRAIGVLSVRSLQENAYSEEDRLLFQRIAVLIGGPVAAAELYLRSMRLAHEMESRVNLELENRKLEEMNQTKARFISMVSHELRTPLTSIIAFTDIIGRNPANTLSERDLSHLAVVKRNGSRLRLLIEDLLAMSEIESGDINIARSEFLLEESISQLADSVGPILNAKNQTLVTEFASPEIKLVSDKIRIEQILANLVSNASKYSLSDSEIKIQVTTQAEKVKIAVIDYGEGIDEHELPSLFDEFSRLDNEVTRVNQGSGLGLAISRRLAAALGGTVEVKSKKGEGSVFTVTLPLDLPEAA